MHTNNTNATINASLGQYFIQTILAWIQITWMLLNAIVGLYLI